MSAPRANPPDGAEFSYFNLPPGWSTDRTLYVEYETPCGAESIDVPDSDIAAFVRAPVGYVLQRLGFESYAQYRRWIDQEGSVRCCAASRSGERCKCRVGFQLGAEDWLAAEAAGWRCHLHGGAPR